MITHDENRERELQIMIKGILEVGPEFYDDGNGPYSWTCPLCYESICGGNGLYDKGVKMEDIIHDKDCPYVIAKDLKI